MNRREGNWIGWWSARFGGGVALRSGLAPAAAGQLAVQWDRARGGWVALQAAVAPWRAPQGDTRLGSGELAVMVGGCFGQRWAACGGAGPYGAIWSFRADDVSDFALTGGLAGLAAGRARFGAFTLGVEVGARWQAQGVQVVKAGRVELDASVLEVTPALVFGWTQ